MCPWLTGSEPNEWLLRTYIPIADSPSILITPVLKFSTLVPIPPVAWIGFPSGSILLAIPKIPTEPFPPTLTVPPLLIAAFLTA